ncbi:MAG: histidine kinase [Arachnia sp.]
MAASPEPRGTVRLIQWGAHLAYLGAIAATYVNNMELVNTMAPWQAVVQAILVPFVVLAVLYRTRVPFALPLLGLVALVTGTDAVCVVGVFSLAIRRSGPKVWAIAIAGGLIRLATLLVPAFSPVSPKDTWPTTLLFVLLYMILLPLLVGAYIRTHRRLEASVAERAVRAEVEREVAAREAAQAERERIAQEMHDSVGHVLALIAMQAGALEVSAKDEQTVAAAEAIRTSARTGLADLRAVVRALGADARRDPAPGMEAISQLVEASRSAGAVVEYVDGAAVDRSGLPASVGRLLYRGVQESLTNAHRHAPHAPVQVAVAGAPGQGISLTVRNPLAPGGERGAGTGLASLRNRVEVLGGSLDAHATKGVFELSIKLPWEET